MAILSYRQRLQHTYFRHQRFASIELRNTFCLGWFELCPPSYHSVARITKEQGYGSEESGSNKRSDGEEWRKSLRQEVRCYFVHGTSVCVAYIRSQSSRNRNIENVQSHLITILLWIFRLVVFMNCLTSRSMKLIVKKRCYDSCCICIAWRIFFYALIGQCLEISGSHGRLPSDDPSINHTAILSPRYRSL